jgi:hypothetical protein
VEESIIMTDHEEQIYNIIHWLTGYEGSFYPNRRINSEPSVNNPDFLVWISEPDFQNGSIYSEMFKVFFKASSRSELQSIKSKILNISTTAPNGYNGTFTINNVCVEDTTYNSTIPGLVLSEETETIVDVQRHTTNNNQMSILRFDVSDIKDFTLNSAAFKLSAYAPIGASNILELIFSTGVYTSTENLTNLSEVGLDDATSYTMGIEDTLDEQTLTDTDNFSAALAAAWGSTKTNVMIAFIESDTLTGYPFYAVNSENDDSKYPNMDLSVTVPTDYPFYLFIVNVEEKFSENEFYITFTLEARWQT